MKKLTLILTLFILSVVLSVESPAQTGNGGYLIIKMYESIDMRYNKIVVTENGNRIEQIDLGRVSYSSIEPNQIVLNNMLDKYKAKGYKLASIATGTQTIASSTDVLSTTYIFEK